MSYTVFITKRAQKELIKLPTALKERLAESIGLLGADPGNPRHNITRLVNDAEASYRLRVGRFRIKFNKNDQNKVIEVVRVVDRKDAYR